MGKLEGEKEVAAASAASAVTRSNSDTRLVPQLVSLEKLFEKQGIEVKVVKERVDQMVVEAFGDKVKKEEGLDKDWNYLTKICGQVKHMRLDNVRRIVKMFETKWGLFKPDEGDDDGSCNIPCDPKLFEEHRHESPMFLQLMQNL